MTYEVRVQEPDGWITVIHVADDQEVWENIPTVEAAQELADRMNAGDQSVVLYGPMFCETHRQTLWPHDDCIGPGVWLPNAELAERSIYPKDVGVQARRSDDE